MDDASRAEIGVVGGDQPLDGVHAFVETARKLVEFFQKLLDTVPLTGEQWWICIGAGAVIVVVSEVWKFFLRRQEREALREQPVP